MVTSQEIIERISQRLAVLGNKTRGTKSSDEEKLRAAHGARELTKLRDWILTQDVPCPHYEDNQGFCHKCGILMNEDRAYHAGLHPDQLREEAGAGGEYPRQNLSCFI